MNPVRPSARATAMPRSVPPTPNFSAELPGPVRSATLTVVGWTCAVLMPRSVTTSLFGNTAVVSLTDAELAAELARDAGELLLQVRDEVGFWDPYDLGDAGDKRANTLILDGLARDRPADAVLSEEAVDDLSRVHADRVWIVDPLDGTWEFSDPAETTGPCTSRCGSATVQPGRGIGSSRTRRRHHRRGGRHSRRGEVYRTDTVTPPHPARRAHPDHRQRQPSARGAVAASDQMDIQLIRIGSAGAKAMAVVNGDVDAYLHAGGQWEWDSAAPAGVVRAAGLHASRLDGSPLSTTAATRTCPTC